MHPHERTPRVSTLWPPTEVAEGYQYESIRENYTLTDGARTMHISYVQPLQHSEGMLMAYLPVEKIAIEADLYDPPNPPTPATTSFVTHVRRLGLDVQTIVPIHGPVTPWSELVKALR